MTPAAKNNWKNIFIGALITAGTGTMIVTSVGWVNSETTARHSQDLKNQKFEDCCDDKNAIKAKVELLEEKKVDKDEVKELKAEMQRGFELIIKEIRKK